jgi:hypothetical protein
MLPAGKKLTAYGIYSLLIVGAYKFLAWQEENDTQSARKRYTTCMTFPTTAEQSSCKDSLFQAMTKERSLFWAEKRMHEFDSEQQKGQTQTPELR